jgi:hypothetical protein
MLISLQVRAITVELNGVETVIGAVYHNPSKPFEEADFDTFIGLSRSKRFIFGGDLNAKNRGSLPWPATELKLILWLDSYVYIRILFASTISYYGVFVFVPLQTFLWINLINYIFVNIDFVKQAEIFSSATRGRISCVLFTTQQDRRKSEQLDFLLRLVRANTLNLSESCVNSDHVHEVTGFTTLTANFLN